jgi:hypothetical protein
VLIPSMRRIERFETKFLVEFAHANASARCDATGRQ